MGQLLVAAGAVLLTLLSFRVTAQIVAPVDTIGLHNDPAAPATASPAADGLADIITAETYWTIGHGGPAMICEELPT